MITLGKLFQREGGECCYCGEETIYPHDQKSQNSATIDHALPKARGGQKLASRNTVLACKQCNEVKGDMTIVEFVHFKKNGEFSRSYVRYLEQSLMIRLNRTK